MRKTIFRYCLKQNLKNGTGPLSPRTLRATQSGQYVDGKVLSTPENQKTKMSNRILIEMCEDAGTLCRWLCCFVTGTRRSDGEEYTQTSVHSFLAGL